MGTEEHLRFADNAFYFASSYFKRINEIKESEKVMALSYAHTARIHYEFASNDVNEEKLKTSIEDCDHLIISLYQVMKFEDIADWYKHTTHY